MYDTEELLPSRRPRPAPRSAPLWLVAAMTVAALGVALGAALPHDRASASPQRPSPAVTRPAHAEAARPAPPATPGWMDLGPVEPGRAYAPVGGPVVDEPSLAPAPGSPVAPAAEGGAPDSVAPPARRSPAASLRAVAAAELPLLAVRRGSGRIVFHEMAAGGTAGAELEGEWAVVGRCGERLRLDLAQPARTPGAPRGVGVDVSSEAAWDAAVAVPAQGCRVAAGRVLHPRPATAADRERFAASAGGFAPGELRQVASTAGAAWLVFAGRGRTRAAVALFHEGAWREAWSHESDALQKISLVFRRGGEWEGVFVTTRGGSPDAFQRVRITGGGALPDAPASLRG